MSILDTLQIDYPQQVGKYLRRPAWIVAWNDGDTGHLLTTSKTDDNRWETALLKVRLAHIDAPETSTPQGAQARDWLRQRAPQETRVTFTDLGPEKWGRRLAQIDHDGVNLSSEMLRLGYAKPYEGGKRIAATAETAPGRPLGASVSDEQAPQAGADKETTT